MRKDVELLDVVRRIEITAELCGVVDAKACKFALNFIRRSKSRMFSVSKIELQVLFELGFALDV